MTATQKARLAGFNASLKQRGVSLLLDESNPALKFCALIERSNPDAGEFIVSDAERDAVLLHILRITPDVTQVGIGSTLVDIENDKWYRVTKIEDKQVNIALVFHCEESPIVS